MKRRLKFDKDYSTDISYYWDGTTKIGKNWIEDSFFYRVMVGSKQVEIKNYTLNETKTNIRY